MRKVLATLIAVALLMAPAMGQAGLAHASAGSNCHGMSKAEHATPSAMVVEAADADKFVPAMPDTDGAAVVSGECCIAGCTYVPPEVKGFAAPSVTVMPLPVTTLSGQSRRPRPIETPPPRLQA